MTKSKQKIKEQIRKDIEQTRFKVALYTGVY